MLTPIVLIGLVLFFVVGDMANSGRAAVVPMKAGRKPAAPTPTGSVKKKIVKQSAGNISATASQPWFSVFAGANNQEYQAYMRDEWGHEKRGDVPLFEKLCLEGQQAGLSWATVLAKRAAYRKAFHNFNIKKCAAMSEKDIDAVLVAAKEGPGGRDAVICHRGKLLSIASNARCVLNLKSPNVVVPIDPVTGSPCRTLDALLWSFVGGSPVLNSWQSPKAIPLTSPPADAMAKALKKLGFSFVGPTICYSLMQSCGLIIDHPVGTPEHTAAAGRLAKRKWARGR